MILLSFAFVLADFVTASSENAKALRPCFERYPNHRLVNLQPFHSEWRMKKEENCLQFCSDTRSRCRSIVYDAVQHICHFFLDEGFDVTVPAPKMVYLKLTTESIELPSIHDVEVNHSSNDSMSFSSHQETFTTQVTDTDINVEPFPEIVLPEEFEFKKLHENEVLRDMNGIEHAEKRWQSSMEELSKNEDDYVFKGTRSQARVKGVPTKEFLLTSEEKENLDREIQEKYELFKRNNPSEFDQLHPESKSSSSTPLVVEIVTTSMVPEVVTPSLKMVTLPKNKRMKFSAKRITFSDNNLFPRKTEATEIRRHQGKNLKQVKIYEKPSYLNKALSFLNVVNDKKNPTVKSTMKNYEKAIDSNAVVTDTSGCSTGHVPIWLVFENSVGSENIDSSFAKDWKECRKTCLDESCRSFTFFDDQQCMINMEDDGVNLRKPPQGDYMARTDLKFCYPDSISPYHTCSNFIAFRDYSIKVKPREEFYGLPLGYDGLKLCIELCVLSTQYNCKSATFTTLEGVCSLNEENSLSNPDRFELSTVANQLYFENGCALQPELSPTDKSYMSIERITLKSQNIKPPSVKSLGIKPIPLRQILLKPHRSKAGKQRS
ncbi:PAN domain protein [Dictyocaulus viviparus]|uniref:PAN domain protein n=1 Tax=Dictyocaulus viviparus TaxID=29172 RepID=A0A0D8X7W5_DICVI|nr:PAN domain protein [Dictyocaulus viviparus]